MSLDLQIRRLTRRVERLERDLQERSSEVVRGWERASRVVGLCAKTIRLKVKESTFPKPFRVESYTTGGGKVRQVPIWRRIDLEKGTGDTPSGASNSPAFRRESLSL